MMKLEDYIKPIKIGNVIINNNVFLAPMAGVTDRAYRNVCKNHMVGLQYTEMVSAKALSYEDDKTNRILATDKATRPNAVQIFGHEPKVMKEIIEKLNQDENIDIIDINMGCPMPKITKNGDGAGMLKSLETVEEIIKIATEISKKPITIKTRKGIDEKHVTAIDIAKICNKYNVSAITIHGRLWDQYYTGKSDLDIIKAVKEVAKMPVIGNGDITDRASALRMFEYTNCDAIMIGRAAEGNPWIFDELLNSNFNSITNKDILNEILYHIEKQLEYEDEHITVLKMRKHIAWYLKHAKNIDNINQVKNRIYKQTTIANVKIILKDVLNKS